jgi:hypothetical protein
MYSTKIHEGYKAACLKSTFICCDDILYQQYSNSLAMKRKPVAIIQILVLAGTTDRPSTP